METEIDNRALFSLYGGGMISRMEYLKSLTAVKKAEVWRKDMLTTALTFAIMLPLAAVLIFLTDNWHAISLAGRMALLQGAMAALFAAAWFTGLEKPSGRLALGLALTVSFIAFDFIQNIYASYFPEYRGLLIFLILTLPLSLLSKSKAVFSVWYILNGLKAVAINDRELYVAPAWLLTALAIPPVIAAIVALRRFLR